MAMAMAATRRRLSERAGIIQQVLT